MPPTAERIRVRSAALEYCEYDYHYTVGESGHGYKHMAAIILDAMRCDAMRWLWRS